MLNNDMGNKETKKEKNINHGMIALVCIAITVILIIIGVYFYGQNNVSKEVTPPKTNQETSSLPAQPGQ